MGKWLGAQELSHSAFARRLGASLKMVEYWANGQALPGLVYAFRIERATKGGVPVSSWLGTELGRLQWSLLDQKSEQ